MRNRPLAWGAIAMLTVALASCLPSELLWTGTYSFPGSRWTPEEKVDFVPDSAFMEGRDDGTIFVLSMRYGSDASLESLPIVVETESPESGMYAADTIRFRLMKAADRTADKARMGIFESVDTLRMRIVPAPGWSMTIYPLDEITDVYSLTLEIKK